MINIIFLVINFLAGIINYHNAIDETLPKWVRIISAVGLLCSCLGFVGAATGLILA